jgi:hypothetical protein
MFEVWCLEKEFYQSNIPKKLDFRSEVFQAGLVLNPWQPIGMKRTKVNA